ncbi:MAG: hypothetical protein OXE59_07625 [Bacteroidetes bacterium]|nr:hypothetical protein [Bacteroidota bacterium]
MNIDGNAYIVGLRVGQSLMGTSKLFMYEADLFVRKPREIQSKFQEDPEWFNQLSSKLEHHGVDLSRGIELQLVDMNDLDFPPEKMEELKYKSCLNRTIVLYGLTIIEKSKRIHVTIHEKANKKPLTEQHKI